VVVEPNAALAQAHAVARGVQRALKTARPRKANGGTVTATEPAVWLARKVAALSGIERDVAALDTVGARRRAAALTNAPVTSVETARQRLTDVLTRARAAGPEDAISQISGVPPEAEAPAQLTPSTEDLATGSRRAAWLSDLSRVRPALDGVDILDLAHRRHAQEALPISLWRPAILDSTGDRRIVIVGTPPSNGVIHGITLDEWKESVPRGEVTSGLAFHHDSPSSRAPQAILIAVPPDPAQRWSLQTLDETVAEAIDLSFIRLARPAAVWGGLLPAIYLAENLEDDTVSTPLSESAITTVITQS
jgi:hypothetical protein